MTPLTRCPGVHGEGCEALLAAGRDVCNFCRRDRERLDPTPTKENPTMTASDELADIAEAGARLANDPKALRARLKELEAEQTSAVVEEVRAADAAGELPAGDLKAIFTRTQQALDQEGSR